MKIRKCKNCSAYTFKIICSKCGSETRNPNPPKYSPDDKYGILRRKFKKESAVHDDS